MLRVVIGTGLADPSVRLRRVLRKRSPCSEHPVARCDALCPHDRERHIVHRVMELLVHRIDVQLLGPICPETDPLEDEQPIPDLEAGMELVLDR